MKFKGFIKGVTESELFRGGFTLLILINIGHVLNYVFHFVMARMLGPADYGILAVLTSITYIFNIPTFSIQTIVSKQVIKLKIRGEVGRIKGMIYGLIKKMVLVSAVFFIIFAVISKIFLSEMLKISFWLLILTGTFLFGAVLYPIGVGVLQGLKKFKIWGWNFVLDCGVRLVLSIILVLFGFRVYGAVIGTVMGLLVAFIFIFPFIGEVLKANPARQKVETKIISRENLTTFLAMLFIVFMYSLDVILVGSFFSAEIVGGYAIASLIGKIIFFAMYTLGSAMFPISSEQFIGGGKKESRKIVRRVGIAAFLLCFIAVAALALVPKLIISVLFGAEYIRFAGILAYVGAAFSFISFLLIFLLYKVSTDELRLYHAWILAIFLANYITFLSLFHRTIEQFSMVFMLAAAISFIGGFLLIRNWT